MRPPQRIYVSKQVYLIEKVGGEFKRSEEKYIDSDSADVIVGPEVQIDFHHRKVFAFPIDMDGTRYYILRSDVDDSRNVA